MPKKSKALIARQRNVELGRAFLQSENENMDTNDSHESEYPSLLNSLSPHPGYDMKSSTREIYVNTETLVEQQQAQGYEVSIDFNMNGKEERSKKRYRGTLQEYDEISTEDIVAKYAKLCRRGSTMYSKEVL